MSQSPDRASLAADGLDRIRWAEQFMPALTEASRMVQSSGRLSGRRVGVVLTLEPKTAALAVALHQAGAMVSVHSSASHTDERVAAALESLGIGVFARSDADETADETLMNEFIDTHPEFLIDDGATVARYIHTHRRDALESLKGIAEETTSGVRPLRVMESEGALEVPCLAVNDARVKHLFDNVYGTGQSVVMTLLDTTNTQLQGKSCVVIGYGWVGRGIAHVAHGLGARVTVTEIDPIRALQAIHDGYRVRRLEEACGDGDVFITATGIGHSLTADHMRLMKDGAIVSVGGAGPPEVSLAGSPPLESTTLARPDVRTVPVGEGRSIFLVADGECSNVSAGEGNPIEIMDLSLAVQIRAVDYLAAHESSLAPAVHAVPPEIDEAVASSLLRSLGVELDEPSEAQLRHADSWRTNDTTTDNEETT